MNTFINIITKNKSKINIYLFIFFISAAAILLRTKLYPLSLTDYIIIVGTALFSLLVPFLLPYMHERYDYMAVIFIAIIAFIDSGNLWKLITIEIVSSLGMSAFLLSNSVDYWLILSGAAAFLIYKLFILYSKLMNENKISNLN